MPPNLTQTPPPVPDTAEPSIGNPAPTSTPSFNIIDGSNTVTFTLNVHRHACAASSNAALASTGASAGPNNSFASSRSTAQNPATNVHRPATNIVSPPGRTSITGTGFLRAAPFTDSSLERPSDGITDIKSTVQDGATLIRPAAANAGSPSLSTPNADGGIGIQGTTPTTCGAAAAPRTLYSLCEPYYASPAPEGGRAGINSANYPRHETTEADAQLARLAALIPHMSAHEVYTSGDCALGRSRATVGPRAAGSTDFPASRHRPDPVGMFGNAPSMRRLAAMWQKPPQEFATFQDGGQSRHSRAGEPPAPMIPLGGPEMVNHPDNRNSAWSGGLSAPPRGNRNHAGYGIRRPPAEFITMVNPGPLNVNGFPYAPGATHNVVPTQQTVNPPLNFYGFPYAPGVTNGATTSDQAHAPTGGAHIRRPPAAGRPGPPTPTDTTVAPPPAYTYSGAFPLTIILHPASTILEVVITTADPNVPLTYDDFINTISARIQLPRFWIQPQGGFVVRFNMETARRLVGNEELPMVDVSDVDAMELNLLAVGREEWERQLVAWRAEGRGRWPMGISRWEEGAE